MATYKIVSQFNGLALDVPAFSIQSGTYIQQFADNGAANQQWELIPVGGQAPVEFWIKSRSSGLLLALQDNTTADGLQVMQSADDGGLYQRWRLFLANANGITFVITCVGAGLSLDVPAFSTQSGSRIQQYHYIGGTNQHWQLIRLS